MQDVCEGTQGRLVASETTRAHEVEGCSYTGALMEGGLGKVEVQEVKTECTKVSFKRLSSLGLER